MRRIATILYEDKQQATQKQFPPHDFVLAMVSDAIGTEVFALRSHVEKNSRNGVTKLLRDVENTSLIAGAEMLFVLVDRDRIAEHLGLPKHVSDDEVITKIKARSDAPSQLSVHFLVPNLEGLMGAIAECGGQEAPREKGHIARDLHLNNAAFSQSKPVRDCVRRKQSSLSALVDALVSLLRTV